MAHINCAFSGGLRAVPGQLAQALSKEKSSLTLDDSFSAHCGLTLASLKEAVQWHV
jgi:hypothetical protein